MRARPSDLSRQLAKLGWKMRVKEGQLALIAEGAGWCQVAGTVLSDILVAQQNGQWPRLKACRNPLCSVVFYDSSKNQSRVWHNTSICGNRINLRASEPANECRLRYSVRGGISLTCRPTLDTGSQLFGVTDTAIP